MRGHSGGQDERVGAWPCSPLTGLLPGTFRIGDSKVRGQSCGITNVLPLYPISCGSSTNEAPQKTTCLTELSDLAHRQAPRARLAVKAHPATKWHRAPKIRATLGYEASSWGCLKVS